MQRMTENTWQNAMPMQGTFAPFCTLAENSTHYLAIFDIPGVTRSDIEVYVQGPKLIVRGVRQWDEKTSKKWQLCHHERGFGMFLREVLIPGNIDAEKIDAKLEEGELTVLIPKKGTESTPYKHVDIGHGNKGGKIS